MGTRTPTLRPPKVISSCAQPQAQLTTQHHLEHHPAASVLLRSMVRARTAPMNASVYGGMLTAVSLSILIACCMAAASTRCDSRDTRSVVHHGSVVATLQVDPRAHTHTNTRTNASTHVYYRCGRVVSDLNGYYDSQNIVRPPSSPLQHHCRGYHHQLHQHHQHRHRCRRRCRRPRRGHHRHRRTTAHRPCVHHVFGCR